MLVAELDDVAKAHVYRALDAHVRWCAVNAITVPNAVRALRAALSAGNGQQRTEVADGPAEGDELGGLMEARLLTPDQVARRLRLSPRSVRRLIGSGVLPSLKIGRARRIAAADVEEFIETRKEFSRRAG